MMNSDCRLRRLPRRRTLQLAGYQPRLEPLECRRMLSATDLLISVYDTTAGNSVLRYDTSTYAPVAGGVATGDHGLGTAQGLAVAPDSSFYVSSFSTAQVLHYAQDGTFLGVLGGSDAMPASIYAPGALAFGPNGNLYVADLGAQTIYQFDTSSPTQQWIPSATLVLGYTPGGFTFSTDANHDLIVGSLSTQSVTQYHSDNTTSTLVGPGSGYNPAALLAEPNGDLLIADFDLGFEPFGHHQVVRYDAVTQLTSAFINLTTPVGTGSSAGWAPQPTSLGYDQDGNLLVGVSPDHNLNGQIQKYDISTGAPLGVLVSGIGTPTGIGFIATPNSSVVGRHLFYNQSGTASPLRYDGNDAAINANDDLAIASDKTALLPGQTATFANVSSYTKGINGIMIDLAGPHGTITASDFAFKVGNNNNTGGWANAPAPISISVRAGAGVSGSDRVELVWANGAIQKQWLQVTMLANANTNLADADVFYFGNAVGDSGLGDTATQANVSATDDLAARNNPANVLTNIPITNLFDYNRDGAVNSTDSLVPRNNVTNIGNVLKFISLTVIAAPEAPTADAAVASALSAPTAGAASIAGQLQRVLDRVHLPEVTGSPGSAQLVQQIIAQGGATLKQAAAAIDKLADELGLEESSLDALLTKLGLD